MAYFDDIITYRVRKTDRLTVCIFVTVFKTAC